MSWMKRREILRPKERSNMSTEKRSFGMHPNLLFDVILRQAGTLQKALLEGVMNAIDAGATECRISLDSQTFSVEDDGRGIQSREEIEQFFETFGTPHTEGDAVYGRFRMGRGQMMAFGSNVWRSRQFQMDVDIKKTGLDYQLTEHKEVLSGTRITAQLYDPIAPSELERIKGELRKFVAWAQIPVFLNDEAISKAPQDAKWAFEDDDAFYNLSADRSQLAVYNLGVLVNSFHAGRFGMGGTIVTKRQIDVNFARNDVQSSCPVFRRIQAYIKKTSGAGAKKKTKLTEAERDMLVNDLIAGEIDAKTALKLRVLTDVNGRTWALDKLVQVPERFSGRLVVSSRGDLMCETAQQRGIAFTVDEATLERFGVNDGHSLLGRIRDALKIVASGTVDGMSQYHLTRLTEVLDTQIQILDREALSEFVDDGHVPLIGTEIGVDEKILITTIEAAERTLVTAMNKVGYEDRIFKNRKIHLGRSETAYAWTDGSRNIWIEVSHARLLRKGMSGAYQIALTLLHEMLHTGPDTGTHEHDLAFYQAFHDLSGCHQDPVGKAAERMASVFTMRLRQNGKKISTKLLLDEDVKMDIEKARQQAEGSAP
jgi:hypothetical protein